MRNSKKGFTLVELLVVIAILAILASVAVVGYTAFIDKAKDSNAKTELHQIVEFVNAELMDDGEWEVSVTTDSTTVTYTVKRADTGAISVLEGENTSTKSLAEVIKLHPDFANLKGNLVVKTGTTNTLVYSYTDGGEAEETLR